VAAGIRYAAANGADIINLSLGGGFSSIILAAIQYAMSLDVLVVAAAGNESAAAPGYPARFSASLANVISVGAYASSGAIASFSNDVGASGAVQVDAPGVGVYSTYVDGRYGSLSGTSMATPHVAGLAALALSANPNLTASQLRSLIVDGTDRAIAGSDSAGGVNAALTVALAVAGRTSSATTTAQAQAQSSGGSVSQRRFASRSVDDAPSASGIALILRIAEDDIEPADRSGSSSPAIESIRDVVRAARDAAVLAIDSADDWWNEPSADDEGGLDETELCDLFAELAAA
jgi:subtilisin family serine protease